jgi:hypothetical protein
MLLRSWNYTERNIRSRRKTYSSVGVVMRFSISICLYAYSLWIGTVIGTLKAKDYALFVSHQHPNGQVCTSSLQFPLRDTEGLFPTMFYRFISMLSPRRKWANLGGCSGLMRSPCLSQAVLHITRRCQVGRTHYRQVRCRLLDGLRARSSLRS